jgi:integrase
VPRFALTDRFCAHAKPGSSGRTDFFDSNVTGLALRVSETGSKSWSLHFTALNGKRARITLGTWPGTSLAEARARAVEAKGEVDQGKDPRSLPGAASFRAVCEEYFERDGKKLRSKEWCEKALARLVYPRLGARLIGDIKRSEIIRLLDRIEDQNGPVMADRTLAIIRKVMNWHASRSDDFRSPIVRGMAKTKPKERERKRTLTDDEIRIVWEATAEGTFGAYVRLLLLTAARRGEAAGAQWSEVVGRDWTIPSVRNEKTGEPHLIPLSTMALELVAGIVPIGGCDFIFSTDGVTAISGFSKFKRGLDERVLAVLRRQDPDAKPLPNWTLQRAGEAIPTSRRWSKAHGPSGTYRTGTRPSGWPGCRCLNTNSSARESPRHSRCGRRSSTRWSTHAGYVTRFRTSRPRLQRSMPIMPWCSPATKQR